MFDVSWTPGAESISKFDRARVTDEIAELYVEFGLLQPEVLARVLSRIGPRLRECQVLNCELTSMGFGSFKGIDRLSRLDVTIRGSDVCPEDSLKGCNNLKEVTVRNMPLVGHSSVFSELRNLWRLTVVTPRCTALPVLLDLSECSSLRLLTVSACRLDIEGTLATLPQDSSLEEIAVQHTRVSSALLADLNEQYRNLRVAVVDPGVDCDPPMGG